MAIPGLPALAAGVVINAVQLIASDILALFGFVPRTQWGLFQNGVPVVVADNVIAFEFKQDYRISSFPIEQGSFESYNKVAVPYDVRLRFSTGGSVSDREAMLASIDAIIGSTDSFDAVTPEKVYQGINPIHQDIRRTAHNGVGLLVVDVYCEQVRVTATQQFANSQQSNAPNTVTQISVRPANGATSFGSIDTPQSPSAAPQVSGGTVQQTAPTATQQSAIDGVLAQSSLPRD